MTLDHTEHSGSAPPGSNHRKPSPWLAAPATVGLIALFYLLREHRNHVAGAWPYLLLACPLMHLFHHHAHGPHGGPGPRLARQ
jgi:hypothetical protein